MRKTGSENISGKLFEPARLYGPEEVIAAKSNYETAMTAAIAVTTESITNSSTEGGWNPAFKRLKLTDISEIEAMLKLKSPFSHLGIPKDMSVNDLRVCFRLVVDSETVSKIQALAAKKGLILEYSYADGNQSGDIVLGMGINGSNRGDDDIIINGGKTDISPDKKAALERNKEINTEKINARKAKIESLEQAKIAKNVQLVQSINDSAPKVNLSILTTIVDLNEVQKYQLATELIKHFGPGWNIDEVYKIDENENLQPIILFDKKGDLASFIIAEKNGNCAELTEMFSVKKGAGAGSELIPKILHVCRQLQDWGELTYYAECNTANTAWFLACQAGGEITGFIPKNVTVKSNPKLNRPELTSFAVITF